MRRGNQLGNDNFPRIIHNADAGVGETSCLKSWVNMEISLSNSSSSFSILETVPQVNSDLCKGTYLR